MKKFKELREASKAMRVVDPEEEKLDTLPSDESQLDDGEESQRIPDAETMLVTAIKPVYKKLENGIYSLNTESVNQMNENVYHALKKIVTSQQPGKVKLGDGSTVDVDLKSATEILQVHGMLNPVNQNKMGKQLSDSASSFAKMKKFASTQAKISSKVRVLAKLG